MDVGIFLFVIARDGIDDGSRLLRSGCVIKIDQLFPANIARENRKITTDFFHVKANAVRVLLSARFGRRNVCSSGHPISSTFLPRSSLRATVESGFTELAISKR